MVISWKVQSCVRDEGFDSPIIKKVEGHVRVEGFDTHIIEGIWSCES